MGGLASSPRPGGACAQCPDTPLTPWEGKEVSGGQEEPSGWCGPLLLLLHAFYS